MSELKDKLLKLAGLNALADAEDCPSDVCDEMIALRAEVVPEVEKTYGPLLRLMVNARILRVIMGDEDNSFLSTIANISFDTHGCEHRQADSMIDLIATEIGASTSSDLPEMVRDWYSECQDIEEDD